jgi:hypothetical protein
MGRQRLNLQHHPMTASAASPSIKLQPSGEWTGHMEAARDAQAFPSPDIGGRVSTIGHRALSNRHGQAHHIV